MMCDVCPGLSAAAGECAPCLHDLPGPTGSQEAAEEDTEAACCQGHQATRVPRKTELKLLKNINEEQ